MTATPAPLANTDDLATMWRPLLPDELPRAASLLTRASALLRQAAPHTDARIAAWQVDPTQVSALDPTLVATVVATIVKRFIANIEGVASQTIGPYHVAYALRTEKDVRGELQITANDLKALEPYVPSRRIGSIRVRAGLAPWPYGDMGRVVVSAYYDSSLLYTGTGAFPVEMPVPIGGTIL